VHSDREPDGDLRDGQVIEVAGTSIHVVHTPGHAPGAVCFSVPDLGVVFSGDTLFAGGPGATGRSYSSFPTILDSIRARLFALPPRRDARAARPRRSAPRPRRTTSGCGRGS